MTLDEILDAYFDGRPSTLWGQAYDITDPERRTQAKGWLKAQLAELARISGGAE